MKKITLIILSAIVVAAVPVVLLGMRAIPKESSPDSQKPPAIEQMPSGQLKLLPGCYCVGREQLPAGRFILPAELNSVLANEHFIVKRGEERIVVIVGVEFTLLDGDMVTVGHALRYAVLAPVANSDETENFCDVCGAKMPPDPAPLPDNPMVRPLGPAALCPECGN